MYIRLEYSESAGHFHFAPLGDAQENRNGYLTLSSKVKHYLAEQFCEQLKQKFPDNKGHKPSFARVKKEFQDFVAEELLSMRLAMENCYQRRTRLFRKH